MSKPLVYDPTDWLDWQDYLEHMGHGRIEGDLSNISGELIRSGLIDLTVKCLESPIFCQRNFMHVIDKDTGELIRYEPWEGQVLYDYIATYQKSLELPQRIIEIKARQTGLTDANIKRGIHNCFYPNRKSVIMMPDQEVLDENAPRIGAVINNLPPFLTLMRRIENKNQWEFDNPNARERMADPGMGSSFTLTIPSSYRGAPGVNFVCFSEFAHYDRAFEIMTAVNNGIGKSMHTCVAIDTTPNGHDPVYEPMVRKAIARNPNWVATWRRKGGFTVQDIITGKLGVPDNPMGWVPMFIGWWHHRQYTTRDDSPYGQLPKLTPIQVREMTEGEKGSQRIGTVEQYGGDEELWGMREFGWSLGRIAWRRFAIDDVQANDWRYKLLSFRQENATTYDDCFVDYGLTPFDPLGLEAMRMQCKPPYVRGLLRYAHNEHSGRDEICVDPTFRSDYQELRVWSLPKPGEFYLIAMDCAYAWESEDADRTVAQVIRRRDEKQVAVYVARCPPHEVCRQIKLLYEWYNHPLTVVETEEGQGYSYVRILWDSGVHNQYYWKRIDTAAPESTKYLGWQSDDRTRPVMYSTAVGAVADLSKWSQREASERASIPPPVVVRDEQTYYELASCKRRPNGNICAAGRNKDDAAIAWMIALVTNRDPEYGIRRASPAEQRKEVNAFFKQMGVTGDRSPYLERPLHA